MKVVHQDRRTHQRSRTVRCSQATNSVRERGTCSHVEIRLVGDLTQFSCAQNECHVDHAVIGQKLDRSWETHQGIRWQCWRRATCDPTSPVQNRFKNRSPLDLGDTSAAVFHPRNSTLDACWELFKNMHGTRSRSSDKGKFRRVRGGLEEEVSGPGCLTSGRHLMHSLARSETRHERHEDDKHPMIIDGKLGRTLATAAKSCRQGRGQVNVECR